MTALQRILEVSHRLSASADLHEILSLVIDAMRDVLGAERATVFEFRAASSELVTTVAHGTGEIRVPISAGLAGESARTRRIIRVDDAYADTRFNTAIDRQTGFRTRALLCIPLIDHDGELVGVAQVLNKIAEGAPAPFTHEDERLAGALAAHAAVAMRRGRLIEDRLERLKLEQELEVARLIQQSSFPAAIPQPRGFEIAGWNQPATQTGGDAYDVIDAEAGPRVFLLMADATGHGVGPALSVTQLRSMLRMAVRLGSSLHQIMQHANTQLCQDLPSGRFITAWIGELNPARHTLRSLSAGQGPLLLLRAASTAATSAEHVDAREAEVLAADHLPLGVSEELEHEPGAVFTLAPGDVFAALSDGIFEARNAAGEMFGVQRTLAAIRESVRADDSAAMIIQRLRDAVNAHLGGLPAEDDQTAIILRRLGA